LLLHAVSNKKIEVIKYLLDKGYDQNKLIGGEVALTYAVYRNLYDVVSLLLKYKPNFSLKTPNINATPLCAAIFREKPKLIELLMENGASFSLEDYRNCGSLYIKV
jgi:ankyrin repeat protein